MKFAKYLYISYIFYIFIDNQFVNIIIVPKKVINTKNKINKCQTICDITFFILIIINFTLIYFTVIIFNNNFKLISKNME